MSRYDISKLFPNYPNDVIKTYESFMTPELQESLSKLASLTTDFSCAISYEFLRQLSPVIKQFSSEFTPRIDAFMITLSERVESMFTPELISCLSNIAKSTSGISEIIKQSATAFSSMADYPINGDFDDYITVDEHPIKDLEIPETLAIPIGHNRVRIKTDVFINFLITIIFALLTFAVSTYQGYENAESQERFQEEQLQLDRERNQTLNKILESVDASNSSQSEAIEELKASFQYVDSALQDMNSDISVQVESPDSRPLLTDNMSELKHTESEN